MYEIINKIKEYELLSFVLIISSYYVAIKLPDLDFKLKLRHRSIITHSPLFTIILISIYEANNKDYYFKYFIIGFSLAIAVHMLLDIFPKRWLGGSTLKIPFNRISCSKKVSIKFFLFTIIFGIFTSIFYTDNIRELIFIYILANFSLIKNRKYEKYFYKSIFLYNLLFLIFSLIKYKYLIRLTLKLINNII